MPRHLQQRRRRWYAVLDIPADVRRRFGGSRKFVRSLETESLTEAERKVPLVIAGWKAEIEEARTGKRSSVKEDLIKQAFEWQKDLEAARAQDLREGQHSSSHHDQPSAHQILDDVLDDRLSDIAWKDPELAETVGGIARGTSLPTAHHLETWLASVQNAAKTKDEKRLSVVRFADAFPYTHLVSRSKVRAWVRALFEKGLSAATVTKDVSQVRGYWRHLHDIEAVTQDADDLFKGAVTKSRHTEGSADETRVPFSGHDLLFILEAARSRQDHQLADLIELAMWTGCRIEELCALKVSEVSADRIRIVVAKTAAGRREVPLHESLQPLVADLKARSEDGFLLSGLTLNKYGDRSNAIGKRFGRLRTTLGFGSQFVFHCIRKTVATKLENAGVPEGVASDILGHKKKTMTYGLYSGGTDFRLKTEAIAKLTYRISEDIPAAA